MDRKWPRYVGNKSSEENANSVLVRRNLGTRSISFERGVYSFLTVYNMSYAVKKTAEIWAKECENGVQKKVFGHFLIKTGSELTLPGYDVVN